MNAPLDTETRLRLVEKDTTDIRQYIQKVDKNLETLTRVEERQVGYGEAVNRAFDAIEKLDAMMEAGAERFDQRIRAIEVLIPGLQEVRGWIILGVLGICSLVFLALWALLLRIG